MNIFLSLLFLCLTLFGVYLLIDYIYDTTEATRDVATEEDKLNGNYGVTLPKIILWFVIYELLVRLGELSLQGLGG